MNCKLTATHRSELDAVGKSGDNARLRYGSRSFYVSTVSAGDKLGMLQESERGPLVGVSDPAVGP